MIKYHPILFSTPMVQAIIEGRKTQTRRCLKYPLKLRGWLVSIGESEHAPSIDFCPYEVGDILWVRETWKYSDDLKNPYWYKADFEKEYNQEYLDFIKGSWKPSIHMYKEACRIFLKVKSIRCERLQDISEEDSIQEGIEVKIIDNIKEYKNYMAKSKEFNRYNDYSYPECPQVSFMTLWQSINGIESLELNPFVWVYEFERIEKPLDFII